MFRGLEFAHFGNKLWLRALGIKKWAKGRKETPAILHGASFVRTVRSTCPGKQSPTRNPTGLQRILRRTPKLRGGKKKS